MVATQHGTHRATKKLSAVGLKSMPPGMHSDGNGLYLYVTPSGGGRSWIFRYKFKGRPREMGLGSLDTFGLAAARQAADECRRLLRGSATTASVDPLDHRRALERAAQVAAQIEAAEAVTFRECAKEHIKAHCGNWRNAKHAKQWEATLATYAYPLLGDLPPAVIDVNLVMKVLKPIWNTKTETAKRLRGRIEVVLDAAKVRKLRDGENPARWKGNLQHLLASPSRIAPVEHWPALPYERIGEFMADLRQKEESCGRLATEFTILTNMRTGSVRQARKSEIDLAEAVWTVPARHLKGQKGKMLKPLKVPLSPPALAIAKKMLAAYPDSEFLFPGDTPGKPISNNTMLKLLKGMGYRESNEADARIVVVHGFRSTFKDWAHEVCTPRFPDDVIEMAMAHAIDDAVEAAYRRGDLFKKRQQLMDAWASYCGCETAPSANVVDYNERRAARG